MISENQIKEIVEAVITQMGIDNKEATFPKVSEVNKQNTQPESKSSECNINNTPENNFEKLEDLAAVDLKKEILVPAPIDRDALKFYKSTTPARIGVWRTGPRPLTRTILRFRADHAVAQDTVFNEVSEEFLDKFDLIQVKTKVKDKDEFLTRPDLGKRLSTEDLEKIKRECPANPQIQIIIADGLSSMAIEANLPHILPAVKQGLKNLGLSTSKDIFVKYGRVGVMDEIGMTLGADVVLLLIGERPGLGTSESMSAYMIYKPTLDSMVSDHTVVSNIHKGGTPPAEAGAHLATVIKKIYDAKASGVKLSL